MIPENRVISALLAEAGAGAEFTVAPLAGGGNNRVYRVDSGRNAFLLKSYFRHQDDPRDRLGTEFAFLKFAWDSGLRCVPQPFAVNRDASLGLYEFVEGAPIAANSVGSSEISQALEFFLALNDAAKSRPESRSLPNGSEACFSMAQHIECVDRRIARLDQVDRSTASGTAAADMIAHQLIPAWTKIRSRFGNSDGLLLQEDLRLSPSDFGFHNTLNRNGKLVFLDFEYAGWDDPAKTVCDFFCQPAVPVPIRLFAAFARRICQNMSDPKFHLQRMRLLLPLYRIKWCCIMLNEFLPVGGRRRSFAREGEDPAARRNMQLEKVSKSLDLLEATEP
jgi:hypothetical protein